MMQNPRRAEEQEGYSPEEQENRRLHGYHQELDRDRDGVPDHLEEEKDSNYSRESWRQNDRNNNGIPDHLETDKPKSGPANDDCLPYTAEAHRNSALDNRTRQASGVAAASVVPAAGASELSKKVAAASAAASQEIRKDESNPKKGEFGQGAVRERMEKLRKKRIPKSSTMADLSRIPAAKGDPDDEMVVFKQAWKGIVQARLSLKSDKKARENAAIDQELRELEKNERELNRAESGQARADDQSREKALGEEPKRPDAPEAERKDEKQKEEKPKDEALSREERAKDPVEEARKAALQKDGSNEHKPQRETETAGPQAEKSGPQPPANDRNPNFQERSERPATAPGQQTGHARERALSGSEAAAPQRSPMLEQARALSVPDAPIQAKAPTNPAPRMRAMGLGNGLSMLVKAVRKETSSETSLEIQHQAQKQRDSGGRGR